MLSAFSDNIDIIPGNVSWHGKSMGWLLLTAVQVEVLTQLNQNLLAETVLTCLALIFLLITQNP